MSTCELQRRFARLYAEAKGSDSGTEPTPAQFAAMALEETEEYIRDSTDKIQRGQQWWEELVSAD